MPFTSALGSDLFNPAGFGFRNLFINGDFSINQRGLTSVGSTTTNSYGLDRWYISYSGGTMTQSVQDFGLGNQIPGYEPEKYARVNITGQSSSSSFALFGQRIEGVRSCAGQTVTMSFWARAGSGTPKLSVELDQRFGTGGSPSSVVLTYAGQVTLSTSWQRYIITFSVPSISGKTIGTNKDDYLGIIFWVSGGSDFNARTNSIGIQSNTFDFWGVQVELNNTATNFEQRPKAIELTLCQRYFESIPAGLVKVYNPYWNVGLSGGGQYSFYHWKVEKRDNPSVLTTAGSDLHSFQYASYNTGEITRTLQANNNNSRGINTFLYSSTNNGSVNLAVGYTSGYSNNVMWVNAEL